jgi:hypothetical protein
MDAEVVIIGPERPDDIVQTPGGLAYVANVHREGIENAWPPIQTEEEVLDSDLRVIYRAYIETEAGEARNNIINVITPGKDARSINLHTSNVPMGIEVKNSIDWHGPGTIAKVLVIEISKNIQPAQYSFELGVEIDGKDYGKVPCIIKVLE